jgi:nucleoside-diphosphate-sugar epimerase
MEHTTTPTHVIFGTGPLAQSVMRALRQREQPVRMVNRSGKANLPAGVEIRAADLTNPEQVFAVTQGASVVYQCAQPPYHKWTELFPPLQRAMVEGVARAGATFIMGDNLYMYGDTGGQPIHEKLPYSAQTRKGQVRARMARELLEAHQAGKLKVAIGRGSDYYGPQALGSVYGERAFSALLKGEPVTVFGDPDARHSFTYIEDFGEALVILGEREAALGEAWHVPNAPAISQRDFYLTAFELAGKEPQIKTMGKWMTRLGGLFIPDAREMVEMMYEFEQAFVVDDSKFKAAFGDHHTPIREGLQKTIDWYREHLQSA